MGSVTEAEIPKLHLSLNHYTDKDKRKILCSKIREACESYGCFLLTCPEIIPPSLREDMFVSMKSLFDLPEETKLRYTNPTPFRSYVGENPDLPLLETFGGIDDTSSPEVARKFTRLMWPEGNPKFCETLQSMGSKLEELCFTIMGMIGESFGLEKRRYEPLLKDSYMVLRPMKYRAPPAGNDETASGTGIGAHTDKTVLTVLTQDQVQGLEIVTRDGQWARVVIPQNCFIIVVGEFLKAWSNGRLMAVEHRVMMRGDKKRYSLGLFTVPKDATQVQAPVELVDNHQPLL